MSTTAKPNTKNNTTLNNSFKSVIFYEIKEMDYLKPYYQKDLWVYNEIIPLYEEKQFGAPRVLPNYDSAARVKGKYIYVFRTSIAGYIKLWAEVYADKQTGQYKYFDVTNGRAETNTEQDHMSIYDVEVKNQCSMNIDNFYYMSQFRLSEKRIDKIREEINQDKSSVIRPPNITLFDESIYSGQHITFNKENPDLSYRPSFNPTKEIINFSSNPDYVINYPILSSNTVEGVCQHGNAEIIYLTDYIEIAENLKKNYIEKRDAYCKWVDEDQSRKNLRTISDIVENLCSSSDNAKMIKGLEPGDISSLSENRFISPPNVHFNSNNPIVYFTLEDIKNEDWAFSSYKHHILNNSQVSNYDPAKQKEFYQWRKDYINFEVQKLFEYEVVAEQIIWLLEHPGMDEQLQNYRYGSFEGGDAYDMNEDSFMLKKYLENPFGVEYGIDLTEYLLGNILERLGESKVGQEFFNNNVERLKSVGEQLGMTYGETDPEYTYNQLELQLAEQLESMNTVEKNLVMGFYTIRKSNIGFIKLMESFIPFLYEWSIPDLQYKDLKHLEAIKWVLKRRLGLEIEHATGANIDKAPFKRGNKTSDVSLFVFLDDDSRASKLVDSTLEDVANGLLDTINLGIAVWQLTQCKSNYEQFKGWISVTGATADFVGTSAQIFKTRLSPKLIAKGGKVGNATKVIVSKIGLKSLAVLGVISGVTDAICSGMDAYTNYDQGDSETAIAHSVTAVGGIVTAVGSIVAIGFPPAGAVIVLIGVVLQIGGTIWAFFADKTDFQLWLIHCTWGEYFLGDKLLNLIPRGESNAQPSWALKPFAEWNNSQTINMQIKKFGMFTIEIADTSYAWAGDLETQLTSFQKLLYDIDSDVFVYKSVLSTGFLKPKKKVAMVVLKLIVPKSLINPSLKVDLKLEDDPAKFSITENHEIMADDNTITKDIGDKTYIYKVWFDKKFENDTEYIKNNCLNILKINSKSDEKDILFKDFSSVIQKTSWKNSLYGKIKDYESWLSMIDIDLKTTLTSDDLVGEEFKESQQLSKQVGAFYLILG